MTRGAKRALDHRCDRSLAVRPRDEDRSKRAIRMAESDEERADLFEAELDAEVLERKQVGAIGHAGGALRVAVPGGGRPIIIRMTRASIGFISRRSMTAS